MADRKSAGQAAAAGGASAMLVAPGEAPWTDEELAEQRAVLGAELSRIEEEVASLQSALSDVLRDGGDGAGDDQADTGTKTFEREQEISLANNILERINQVERALERLDEGSYGWCERCGNPIPVERLAAFPSATLCVTCKQLEERR